MALSVPTVSMPFYEYILDFLARGPSAQELVCFQPPPPVQQRFEELLEMNREGVLSLDDEEELDRYIQIERMMSLLKAKALRYVGDVH